MDQKEFERLAYKHYEERLKRIQNLTPEESQACAKFMMPGYLQRAAAFRNNEIFTVKDLDNQINKCVEIYRNDLRQSGEAYKNEVARLVEADRLRKQAEREEQARLREAEENAKQLWLSQGNDPKVFAKKQTTEEQMDEATHISFLNEALNFHKTKTKLWGHVNFWNRVKAAVLAGDIDKELHDEILERGAGARPSSRFYHLWQMSMAFARRAL